MNMDPILEVEEEEESTSVTSHLINKRN